jgi:GMP synthase (glutamine-hydrolysing)
LRRRGLSFERLDVWRKGARFPAARDFRALVVMGGPMGVYERRKHPFLTPEVRFIRAFLKLGRPVLGVCLGSQLMAAALGGNVHKNKAKEIGWYPLAATVAGKRDALFKTLAALHTAFQWHGDTFTLPAGAVHLARSPLCRHQAFRAGPGAYGLQFHPEVTAAMVRDWLRQPGVEAELAAAAPDARRKLAGGVARHLPRQARLGRAFFDGWCRLIPVG